MSLASAIKVRDNKKNNSSKNPQYYNKKKDTCLRQLASHEEEVVRLAFAENSSSPAKIIAERLDKETDRDVLRAILMNENLSKKKLFEFAKEDDRADMFEHDEELIQYIKDLQVDDEDDE